LEKERDAVLSSLTQPFFYLFICFQASNTFFVDHFAQLARPSLFSSSKVPFTEREAVAWCRGVGMHNQRQLLIDAGITSPSSSSSSSSPGGAGAALFVTLEQFIAQVKVQRLAEQSEVAALRVWQHILAFQV
jgi:hypothetical protein